jgi:hypothetical protein
VRSAKEIVNGIVDDPVKLKRAFTFIWVVAYSILILGFLLIVWVFYESL